MLYLILLILGLLLGAVFLGVLLAGDRREARLEAQAKALQEQITAASAPSEATWPPPPSAAARPQPSPSKPPAKPAPAPGSSRAMVQAFFRLRNYAIGTVLTAYLISTGFPRLGFVWALLITALAAVPLMAISAKRQKPGR